MTSARPKLITIDNGAAGMHTVGELPKLTSGLYDITVSDEEPHGSYNHILLSPALAGEKQVDDIMLNMRKWYGQDHIMLHAGDLVVAIDRLCRVLRSRDGVEMRYNRLLIATGSHPFILPVSGHLLPGAIASRDIRDVKTMLETTRNHRRAVIIGGDLLGFETASGLMRQGTDMTVVHLPDMLTERQLDKPVVQLSQKALEAKGLRFLLGTHTVELLGTDRVTAVRFKDDTQVPVGLVVMIAGVRPNIEPAKAASLYYGRAIIVDSTLQTYGPRTCAVSECVQHRNTTFGFVAPIQSQARVCTAHLAGTGHRHYVQQVTVTKLKVIGVDLYPTGDFISSGGTEDIVLYGPRRDAYKCLVLREDRIVDVVPYDGVADGPRYFDLIQCGVPITLIRQRLSSG